MTAPTKSNGEGRCPYPVREFNGGTTGPVLSHAEEIDALARNTPSCAAPSGAASG